MLSEKEASRVMRLFQRELGLFSQRVGGVQRAREQALAEARAASDYLQGIAGMLASRHAPVRVETTIKRGSGDKSDQFWVNAYLEGVWIGDFWIAHCYWFKPYTTGGSSYHYFRRALHRFGRLLVHKEAYRQVLLRRLTPFQEVVAAEFAEWISMGRLVVETGFQAGSGWDVGKDYCYLRLRHGDWQHTLRAYGDRYTWGISFQSPTLALNCQEEMVDYVRGELRALAEAE